MWICFPTIISLNFDKNVATNIAQVLHPINSKKSCLQFIIAFPMSNYCLIIKIFIFFLPPKIDLTINTLQSWSNIKLLNDECC